MEYSSEYKKSIIELWNKIGAEVAKAFNLSVAKDAYGIVIGEIQSDLLVFSKNITLMYDFFSVYSETNLGLISTNEKNSPVETSDIKVSTSAKNRVKKKNGLPFSF